MLSVLILALGLGAPAQGFVIPTLERPLLGAPTSAPLLTLRQSPPAAARIVTTARESSRTPSSARSDRSRRRRSMSRWRGRSSRRSIREWS